MKIKISTVLAILGLVILTGCGSIFTQNKTAYGKASAAEDKSRANIAVVDTSIANLNVERLTAIGTYSSGVAYALAKETNADTTVQAAQELNERVVAISEKPDFNSTKAMESLVDQLITNKVQGEKVLKQKDATIENLNVSVKTLESEKGKAITAYMNLADKTASQADAYKETLGQMDSFGGLGAVWYGLKLFIKRMAWILGIGGVLFLILRILSFSNPLAASVFSIFSTIGSWVINTVEYIFPKAISSAGLLAKSAYMDAQTVLEEVLSGIKTAEAASKATNTPINTESILAHVATSLSPSQQAILSNAASPAQDTVLTTVVTTKPVATTVTTTPTPAPVAPVSSSVAPAPAPAATTTTTPAAPVSGSATTH